MGDNQSKQDISNEKPFDNEPFEAGVEADEESDPKKFIQQLSGKLGQSLRKYNKETGTPDFELEKFAVNSVLSATHTSEMDPNDQKDIINKVKSSGRGDGGNNNSDNLENLDDDNTEGDDEESTEENIIHEEQTEIEKDNHTLYPKGWKEMDGMFMNSKRSSIFAPEGSPEAESVKHLEISEKNSIFDSKQKIKEMIKNKLASESYSHIIDNVEPEVLPQVKPTIEPVEPLRKNKPFLPKREVKPDPKAINNNNIWKNYI